MSRLGSGALFARVGAGSLTTPLVLLAALVVFALPSAASSFLLQIPASLAVGLSRGLLRVTAASQAFDVPTMFRLMPVVFVVAYVGLVVAARSRTVSTV